PRGLESAFGGEAGARVVHAPHLDRRGAFAARGIEIELSGDAAHVDLIRRAEVLLGGRPREAAEVERFAGAELREAFGDAAAVVGLRVGGGEHDAERAQVRGVVGVREERDLRRVRLGELGEQARGEEVERGRVARARGRGAARAGDEGLHLRGHVGGEELRRVLGAVGEEQLAGAEARGVQRPEELDRVIRRDRDDEDRLRGVARHRGRDPVRVAGVVELARVERREPRGALHPGLEALLEHLREALPVRLVRVHDGGDGDRRVGADHVLREHLALERVARARAPEEREGVGLVDARRHAGELGARRGGGDHDGGVLLLDEARGDLEGVERGARADEEGTP
ncbi:hypothetical protein DAPPUDRAFT_126129, partial [Daphnia pulex]